MASAATLPARSVPVAAPPPAAPPAQATKGIETRRIIAPAAAELAARGRESDMHVAPLRLLPHELSVHGFKDLHMHVRRVVP